jgi:quercetin dioxygenase-like cupin family protein
MPAQATTDHLTFIDVPARILIDGDDTEGRYGLVDMVDVPAGHMPPLHVHHSHDEGFFVLEGELTLLMPGEEVALKPGDAFLAPRGIPHTYRVGGEPARWLVTSTPAGFERFVAAVDALQELDPERLAAAADDHGIEILGPPGMLP